MIEFIRTKITEIKEVSKKVFFSGTGRAKESFKNREVFQHYGFTSKALEGAEGIILKQGNNIVLIASDDKRYKLTVKNGEVALYTDEGDYIHFKRGNKLEIKTETLNVDCKNATVKASEKAIVEGTAIELNGGGDLDGIITGKSVCHFTGSPHADKSTTVKATK